MKITEVKRDLFTVDPKEYVFAHCISADCKRGAGIAVPMAGKFHLHDMKEDLKNLEALDWLKVGETLYYNGVCNLITKERYFHKPTIGSMWMCLNSMKDELPTIKKIAQPEKIIKERVKKQSPCDEVGRL